MIGRDMTCCRSIGFFVGFDFDTDWRAAQMSGVVAMLIGFVVALAMVSSHFNTAHKQIGLVVVIIGALQVCALPPVCVPFRSITLLFCAALGSRSMRMRGRTSRPARRPRVFGSRGSICTRVPATAL